MMSWSVLVGGCFPHNATKRTYAQLGEGAAIVGSLIILNQVKSGADCDQMLKVGQNTSDCKSTASTYGNIGFSLLLAGLVGFIATVSSAEDDAENEAPKPTSALTPAPPPPAPTQPMPAPTSPTPPPPPADPAPPTPATP